MKQRKIFNGVLLGGLLVLALFVGLVSTSSSPHRSTLHSPDIVMESLDESVRPYEYLWRQEIGRRFHGAVGVIVHGGDFVEGQWITGTGMQPWKHVTPIEDIIIHFEHLYPDRTIVLVSCNPGHIVLHGHPRIWYATDSVWVFPDRMVVDAVEAGSAFRTFNLNSASRWEADPNYVGSIFEFVNAE